VHGSLRTLLPLQAYTPLQEQPLAFLRTRPFSHQINGGFQSHLLASQPFDGNRLEESFPFKDIQAARRCIQTQQDAMSRQGLPDGRGGSIHLKRAIAFHPSWRPPPIKIVEEADQDQPSQARSGVWAKWDEPRLAVACDNCALEEAVPR
jgi:hypothetical protein